MLEQKPDPKLERMLEKHLGRVSAPKDLWSGVGSASREAASFSSVTCASATRGAGAGWQTWALAAAAFLVAIGTGVVWQGAEARNLESLAVQSLNGALNQGKNQVTDRLEFRSADAAAVRAWVRDKAGLDIPLPPLHSELVEIEGAQILRPGRFGGGAPIAEISYRVGGDPATLLVATDSSGAQTYPNHQVRASDPFESARVSSWNMRGQSYTLAWAAQGEFRVACLLCHGNEPMLDPSLMNEVVN